MALEFARRLDNVEASAIREVFKLLGKPGLISFAGGFPDSTMFDVEGLKQAAAEALGSDPGAALQYGATEGYAGLREQLVALMAARQISGLRPEDLIVTTGSQQALDLLGKILINPGDKVIVEAPTFLAAIQAFRLYGADVICAPVDEDGVRVDVLEQLIIEHKPSLVYLIPTFGNPSGMTLSLERRRKVVELAARHQTLIVEDDPYGELYFGEAPPPMSILAASAGNEAARAHLAYCGSLSKTLSPGLRLGWMVAPADVLSRAAMCKQFSDANSSTFAQVTAARYLASGRMGPGLVRARAAYAERAQAMGDALTSELGERFRFTRPRGGLFYWGRLTGAGGSLASAAELLKRSVEKGVAFVPGAPFYARDPDPAALRLSFAMTRPDSIRDGIGRLASALAAPG